MSILSGDLVAPVVFFRPPTGKISSSFLRQMLVNTKPFQLLSKGTTKYNVYVEERVYKCRKNLEERKKKTGYNSFAWQFSLCASSPLAREWGELTSCVLLWPETSLRCTHCQMGRKWKAWHIVVNLWRWIFFCLVWIQTCSLRVRERKERRRKSWSNFCLDGADEAWRMMRLTTTTQEGQRGEKVQANKSAG